MLYRRSGLLGVSGLSGDVRVLLASDAPVAREALDLFTYRIAWEAGALVSALGGLDGLVFTAGIGEHAPRIRAEVCAGLNWLGLRLDTQANLANAGCISLPDSAIDVRVIATNEEAMIAHHTETMTERGGLTGSTIMTSAKSDILRGKRGLVVGIANGSSIATGCARAFVGAGATLAATYLNEKALPFVRAVTEPLGCALLMPCDVHVPGQLEAVFDRLHTEWGGLDFLLHSIAFAPRTDLHGRVVDCSAEGFGLAMDISCHSFLRMARLAEPLMPDGGCLLTVTFFGSERVVPHYNLMGPVKAALESAMRYTAAELGPQGIRAHAISPGPISTRAAGGLDHFDDMLAEAAAVAPERHLVDIDDVGALAAFLVSDSARRITGTIIPVDGGAHLLA
jgi:enoyl-[acyl-carrier protein] reductase I